MGTSPDTIRVVGEADLLELARLSMATEDALDAIVDLHNLAA